MEPRMASRARVRIGVFMIDAIDGEFCRFCRTVTRNQIGKSTNHAVLRIAFIHVVTQRQNRQNVPKPVETTRLLTLLARQN